MVRVEVIYKDANIIIIFKPEGLLSVPFSGSRGKTAQGIVEQILRKNGEYSAKYKPLPVHRLDRETSGVMMFATNERAQKIIMDSWHQMVKSRTYVALAENPLNYRKYGILPDSGIITDNIAYNAYNIGYVPDKSLEQKSLKSGFEVSCKHKNQNRSKEVTARTHFKILKRFNKFTLFELELDTGRKNQIRAHLASKGYPLVGDKNYRAKSDLFARVCLHAKTLVYIDPWTKEEKSFSYDEPKEWMLADWINIKNYLNKKKGEP